MHYVVIESHRSEYPRPIRFAKGTLLNIGPRYEGEAGWQDWYLCTCTGQEPGWSAGPIDRAAQRVPGQGAGPLLGA